MATSASVARETRPVKVVMTLLARDEADIVDAQLAFHLRAGVDFVVATDNRSDDGTTEILERYERAGHLHLIRERGDDMRQDVWVTRMARLAATEFAADWVINADADEFWWPRGGSLKEVLELIPDRYGVVRGCWRHFLPRAGEEMFAERMTLRLGAPAHPGAKETIFHAHQKVAHRADPSVSIEPGNHDVTEGSLAPPFRGWHPLEVLHFSLRSVAQLERKAVRDWRGWVQNPHGPTLHQELAYEAQRDGRLVEYFDSFVLSDDDLERGLADGTLAIDTRLRDALWALRDESGGFRLPDADSPRLAFPRPGVDEDALYAGEASVLVEIDGVVRAEQRVDSLESRLAELERGPLSRARHRLGLSSR